MKLRITLGLPHPSLFPLERARFDCLPPSASLGDLPTEADLVSLNLGRGLSPGDLDLTQFLQYGTTSSIRYHSLR